METKEIKEHLKWLLEGNTDEIPTEMVRGGYIKLREIGFRELSLVWIWG